MLTRFLRSGAALPRLLSNTPVRFVSQSKPAGAAGTTAVTEQHPAAPPAEHGEVSPFVKNPNYHGYSDDPVIDEWSNKLIFFFGISLVMVLGGTYLHYSPDYGNRQWCRREAERLILQREKEGLPLISENYYDPSKIILPSAGEE